MPEENESEDLLDDFDDDLPNDLDDELDVDDDDDLGNDLEGNGVSKSSRKKFIFLAIFVLFVVVGVGYYSYSQLNYLLSPDLLEINEVAEKEDDIISSPTKEESPPDVEKHEAEKNDKSGLSSGQVNEALSIATTTINNKEELKVEPELLQEKEQYVEPDEQPSIPVPEIIPSVAMEKEKEVNRRFILQIGTYLYKSSVDSVKKVLSKAKFKPVVVMGKVDIPYYQVLVGEFQDAMEVKDIVSKFFSEDINVKFERLSSGMYTLSIMSGFNKAKVVEIKNDLILKGFPARIVTTKKKSDVYILRWGEFSSVAEAREKKRELKDLGIKDSMIVRLH